ncbi:hypothetical protein VTN77DRAFT_1047 [Rasamsonia byssochlamydoides]|uniref:uncharacterized protein n=1 Tax=Rasamsonia byssochlamydoides TaxID=89139 RepID=UPI0037432326
MPKLNMPKLVMVLNLGVVRLAASSVMVTAVGLTSAVVSNGSCHTEYPLPRVSMHSILESGSSLDGSPGGSHPHPHPRGLKGLGTPRVARSRELAADILCSVRGD